MPEVLKGRCPGCKRELRFPSDWAGQTMRCKHCGTVLQARASGAVKKQTPTMPAPAAAGPGVAASAKRSEEAPVVEPATANDNPFAFVSGASKPAGAANDFEGIDQGPLVQIPMRLRRRRPRWLAPVVMLLLLATTVTAAYHFWTPLVQFGSKLRDQALLDAGEPKDKSVKGKIEVEKPFPRRALAICVNNYLYANPVAYGSGDSETGAVLEKLASALHIDPTQLVLLSDAARIPPPKPPPGSKKSRNTNNAKAPRSRPVVSADSPARTPLKAVIEKTITEFLDSSRPQDRILLLFAGHVVEIDDQAFLVPLEGELQVKESLLPLGWLFDKLKACPARQKLLILDTCRLDPGRGLERPGSGPMGARLDALLAKPPDGVQVWTACVAGEYSYELAGGGVFLNALGAALTQKALKKNQHAEDSLPVEALAEAVQASTTKEIKTELKEKQTPRLAGKERDGGAPYDPAQPLPAKLVIPPPAAPVGGAARTEDVRRILEEIELPPIKIAHAETAPVRVELSVPFSAKKLDDYRPDYTSTKEIESNAEKFPLRMAVLKAVKLIREKFDSGGDSFVLRESFSGATNDRIKADILKEQEKPALVIQELTEARDLLLKVGEERDKESSKRWQAHYDYVLAELLARIAYVEEYSLMLGKIRKDEVGQLESGQTGFRLASRDKLQGTKEFKDMATESKKMFKKLARDHQGTPWEILAKREQLTALGLYWQPTRD
jgi:hypothetical protein